MRFRERRVVRRLCGWRKLREEKSSKLRVSGDNFGLILACHVASLQVGISIPKDFSHSSCHNSRVPVTRSHISPLPALARGLSSLSLLALLSSPPRISILESRGSRRMEDEPNVWQISNMLLPQSYILPRALPSTLMM